MHRITFLLFFQLFFYALFATQSDRCLIVFCCDSNNDLYQVFSKNSDFDVLRYDTPLSAVENAPSGSGLLILSNDYPHKSVLIDSLTFEKARLKSLKLYIEFPEYIPELQLNQIMHSDKDRLVLTRSTEKLDLLKDDILELHDCYFKQINFDDALIVLAKVAGYDSAVFGLSDTSNYPILFIHPTRDIMISATKLSGFKKGRYAPKERWASVWSYILNWLDNSHNINQIEWKEIVHPTFNSDKQITKKDRLESFVRGVDWFYNSNLIVPVYNKESQSSNEYNINSNQVTGSNGIYECYMSDIEFDGTQSVSERIRADCTSETAMAISLRSFVNQDYFDLKVAENMQDFIYVNSALAQNERNDSLDSNYGYIGWSTHPNNHDNYYGDDNARTVLGTIMTSSALGISKWDKNIIKTILANYRTTSIHTGFKPRRLRGSTLSKIGHHFYQNQTYYHYSPHFQSWIWACYLWLYDKTGYKPLLDISKEGIRNMMNQYPANWEWANGLQQERARMILPISWLIRIEGTEEQRDWLDVLIKDLLEYQDESGAIREILGTVGKGMYSPPETNLEFGSGEAPLIQNNGEPIADLLYTCNFALVSLNEALAVTDNVRLKDGLNNLIDFLVKIQVSSIDKPQFDGAWFRAFDYNRWQYWGSSSDHGWGVWTTQTGWTQSWICSTILLNELKTTIWDFTKESKVNESFESIKSTMLK